MLELNLLAERTQLLQARNRGVRYFRLFFLLCGLVFLLFAYRFVSISSKLSLYQKELKSYHTEIETTRGMYGVDDLEQEWVQYYNDLLVVGDIFEQRTYWAGKIQDLATYVPPELTISAFTTGGSQVEQAENSAATPDFVLDLVLAPGPKQKQGFEIADEFINALKSSKYFNAGARLLTHDRVRVKDVELEQFRILVNKNAEQQPESQSE